MKSECCSEGRVMPIFNDAPTPTTEAAMDTERKVDVLGVLDHVLAVYQSMANRGAYPAELMHDDDRHDGKRLFLGVQGFIDVVKAREAVAELIEADREYNRAEDAYRFTYEDEGLSRRKAIREYHAAIARRHAALSRLGASA